MLRAAVSCIARPAAVALPMLRARAMSFLPSFTLLADAGDKKAAKSAKSEKSYNTGAVHGTGVQRKLNIATNENKANARRLTLKGGRGRKPLKIMKKHIDIAKRKKQQRKLQGVHTGHMRPRPMNLYGLLRKLPNNGVGLRVYRSYFRKYDEPSHYTIVKVTPPTETSKCRIFGVLTWRGNTELKVARISRVAAREWHCVEFPDASTVVSSKEKKAAAAAAEAEKAAAPPAAAAVAAESAKQAL